MTYLVGNLKDRFSRDVAHILQAKKKITINNINNLHKLKLSGISVNGERMCAKYWLHASGRLAQEECGYDN